MPSDEQLATMAQGEHLIVVSRRLRGRLKELYCDGYLALRPDLSRQWCRWLTAHGLMHHLVHLGDQTSSDLSRLAVARQERMADLAAGYLIWYDYANGAIYPHPVQYWQLSEIADVPVEAVVHWHHLMHDLARDALSLPLTSVAGYG